MLLPQIFPVTSHTDHVGQGTTFVAIKGFTEDGTKYITVALERGAQEIVVQEDCHHEELEAACKKYNALYIRVPDARKTLAELSSLKLGHPSQKLKIIGITGTKGKTTTAYITEYLLHNAGYKTALISTIACSILDQKENSKHTTPESDYLHMFFAECVKQAVDYVIMEVSSHAISLDRVHGISFDSVGFSNLSNDHLDFYGSLESYFHAKMQLFSMVKPNGIITINTDSEWGERALPYAQKSSRTIITYGTKVFSPQQHTLLTIEETSFQGISLTLHTPIEQHITCPSLFGDFNGYNIAMAILLCNKASINAQQSLAHFPGVPGRLQRHNLRSGAYAFVDYAHNALSFREVLSMLRPYTKHLIVVFGCGGNRPRERRFSMGTIAAQFADTIILTDDNPRFEERMAIINDIMSGIPEEKRAAVLCQPDRYEAIKLATQQAHTGSIVALLGKGHESYYSIQGKNLHFDDFEEISKF